MLFSAMLIILCVCVRYLMEGAVLYSAMLIMLCVCVLGI